MDRRIALGAGRWLILLGGALGFGCVSGTQMHLALPDPPKPVSRVETPAACELVIARVADVRATPGEFGNYLRTKIVADDVDAWLRAQLARLEGPELSVVDEADGPAGTPRVALTFDLAKSYLELHPTMLAATVVGRVSFATVHPLPDVAAGIGDPRYLRGRELNVNWAGTEAEVNALFDEAFDDLNAKLRDEAVAFCTSASGPETAGTAEP